MMSIIFPSARRPHARSSKVGQSMNAATCWTALFLAFISAFASVSLSVAAEGTSTIPFRVSRGVNVYPFLWKLTEFKDNRFAGRGYKGVESYFPLTEFDKMKQMGFDFVRLPVNVGPLVMADDRERAQRIDYVYRQVDAITAKGLKVIVDIHTPDRERGYPYDAVGLVEGPGMYETFKKVVAAMADKAATRAPDMVALELFNEPRVDCQTPGLWEKYQKELAELARRHTPSTTLVLTGSCGGGLYGLERYDPSNIKDQNTIYSIHYYAPSEFIFQAYAPKKQDFSAQYRPRFRWPATDQGLGETLAAFDKLAKSAYINPKAWPYLAEQYRRIYRYYAKAYDEKNVRQDFDKALAWADKYGISHDRLFVGEFGAPRPRPELLPEYNAERLKWLDLVRKTSEDMHIPWTYWCYGDYFGFFDKESGTLDLDMIKSLGLKAP